MQNIDVLKLYGFPDSMVSRWKTNGVQNLLPIQFEAIQKHRLFDGGNLVVSAPTSSGKTMIGELAAINRAIGNRKTLYLVPLKALAEEKYQSLRQQCQPHGFRVVISTRDRKEHDAALSRGDFDIAVVVYEKFFPLVTSKKQVINQFGLVVVDELQMIADPNRGALLDLILSWLGTLNGGPQIVGLSAVIANDGELPGWLNASFLQSPQRPVELRMGYLFEGRFHYWECNSKNEGEELWLDGLNGNVFEDTLAAVANRIEQDEQCLVFVRDKAGTRRFIERLSDILEPAPASAAIEELLTGEETLSRDQLITFLQRGVAYHNADLTIFEREVIERNYRAGHIRVLACTTTLAMGVNLPAKNVFLDRERWCSHNGGRPYLMHLTKGEFANMGGRAGRLGLNTDFGRAIEIAANPLQCEQFRNIYINGELENIKPCMWENDMSTAVMQAVAVGGGEDESGLYRFMQNTLSWRLHLKDNDNSNELKDALSRGLKRCLRLDLLELDRGDCLRVTDLGKVVVKTGITVPSAETLITWLSHCSDERINIIEALLAAIVTEDGLSERFPIPTGEYKARGNHYMRMIVEDIGEERFKFIVKLMPSNLDQYDTVKVCKTVSILFDYIGDFDNKELEQEYGVYFGAIGRMAEQIGWVLEATSCIAKVLNVRESTIKQLAGLSNRVTNGVPRDGVFLARARIAGLGRERIRALLRFGVDSVEALKEVDIPDVERMVTKPVAARLLTWLNKLDESTKPSEVSELAHDISDNQSPILYLIGEMDRRRSSIELDGQQMMLRDREFELLIRLAKARLMTEDGWISKFDLNLPDGGITQGISRLREAIGRKVFDIVLIESDHDGSYRLNLHPDNIHFEIATLTKHWSTTIRELCRAA